MYAFNEKTSISEKNRTKWQHKLKERESRKKRLLDERRYQTMKNGMF